MKKLLTAILAVSMTASLLAGCGGKAPAPSSAPAESKTPASSQAAASQSSEAPKAPTVDRSKKLVVYSNSTSNGQDVWLLEESKKAGFNLEIVSITGGELTNRLIAEKNNCLADVVFGLNPVEYEKLKKNDLLMKYEPAWKNEVDLSLGDPEGYYYPTVVQPLVLIYNKDYKDAPKDWTDLTDPKYKDKFNIFSMGSGTGKNVMSSILMRYKDPKGEYGISAEGWEVAKKYIQNAHIEVKGEDYIGDVISGDRPMSMLWGAAVIKHERERKYDFGIMQPEVGMPYVVEQIAMINGTKNQALAQDFIDWFGTVEVQIGWSNSVGAIPVHPKALAGAAKEIREFMAEMRPQEMDWALVAENIDMWVEKIELEYVN